MSQTHADCYSRTSILDGLIVAAEYENQGVKNLIWQMKYNYVKEISSVLSVILSDYFFSNDLVEYFTDFIVSPVPLHKVRLRARGFNQSALIALEFAARAGLKHSPLLYRTRNSKTQVELEKKERFENVKDLFAPLADENSTDIKKVILVDDVATTGATINECAKTLKKAGISEVWGLVVARNSS
ncbi:MAG: phosphoribosyltransferase family protein [bacterium]|nr:phosphoribosyltransferase family protein [bacterium]